MLYKQQKKKKNNTNRQRTKNREIAGFQKKNFESIKWFDIYSNSKNNLTISLGAIIEVIPTTL